MARINRENVDLEDDPERLEIGWSDWVLAMVLENLDGGDASYFFVNGRCQHVNDLHR